MIHLNILGLLEEIQRCGFAFFERNENVYVALPEKENERTCASVTFIKIMINKKNPPSKKDWN